MPIDDDGAVDEELQVEDDERVVEVDETAEPDADDASSQDAGDQSSDEGDAQAAGPKPSGKARRQQRQREHEDRIREEERQRSEARITELQNQLAQTTQQLGQSADRMVDVVDRLGRPQPKPLIEQARERIREAAKRMDPKNPASVEAFFDEQLHMADQLADARARSIVQVELQKFRQTMPQPPSAEMIRWQSHAPWLSEPGMKDVVNAEIKRLAIKNKRDIKNNDALFEQTVKEALVKVGQEWDKPVTGLSAPNRPAPAAINGGGNRTRSAGSGGGEPSGAGMYTPFFKREAEREAKTNKAYKGLNTAQVYAKFYRDTVAPEIKRKARAGG